MAQISSPIQTAIAGGEIAAYQFVKMGTGGKLVAVTATGDIPVGVAMEAAAADGDAFSLQPVSGSYQMKVQTGAAITDGQSVGTNAGGLLEHKSTGWRLGFLKGASPDTGEIAEVIVSVHDG